MRLTRGINHVQRSCEGAFMTVAYRKHQGTLRWLNLRNHWIYNPSSEYLFKDLATQRPVTYKQHREHGSLPAVHMRTPRRDAHAETVCSPARRQSNPPRAANASRPRLHPTWHRSRARSCSHDPHLFGFGVKYFLLKSSSPQWRIRRGRWCLWQICQPVAGGSGFRSKSHTPACRKPAWR